MFNSLLHIALKHLCVIVFFYYRSTNSTLEKYDLRKPAYVVIFHHLFKNDKALFRKGSEHDLKLIKDFFKKYNAKISDICEDFSVAKVKKKMSEGIVIFGIRKKSLPFPVSNF